MTEEQNKFIFLYKDSLWKLISSDFGKVLDIFLNGFQETLISYWK